MHRTDTPLGDGQHRDTPPLAGAPAPRVPMWHRVLLGVECFGLFVAVPWMMDMRALGGLLIPILIGGALVCLLWLLLEPEFPRRNLWNFRSGLRELPRVLVKFAIAALLLVGFTWWISRQEWTADRVELWGFMVRAPEVYAVIMILYPFFSVYPQELIYRAFFFHRYRAVFPKPWMMITASGLAFAWAHVIFENWVAVALCVPGGLLFAYTYHRSRSLFASGVEHALYGDWVWTVGLGWLFYAGSVGS